ncbi:MAG: hypothetical protein KIT22_16200, partial [Verrucomicrobiae bacterium]|nr:hypothetical protein [Verrucomicrobiae bacterium]
ALEAALRCLQAPPFHQRILNMYFDCPIAFAFQLGNRNKNMGHQAVWHFERGKGYFNVTS